MSGTYILDEDNKAFEVDTLTWGRWFEENHKRKIVKQELLINSNWLSTVFLGLDHQFGENGLPLLFESMLFRKKGDGEDLDMSRCSTWDEAVLMHARMKQKYEPHLKVVNGD